MGQFYHFQRNSIALAGTTKPPRLPSRGLTAQRNCHPLRKKNYEREFQIDWPVNMVHLVGAEHHPLYCFTASPLHLVSLDAESSITLGQIYPILRTGANQNSQVSFLGPCPCSLEIYRSAFLCRIDRSEEKPSRLIFGIATFLIPSSTTMGAVAQYSSYPERSLAVFFSVFRTVPAVVGWCV